jgi:NADH-quinone oxidoreductase subunit C
MFDADLIDLATSEDPGRAVVAALANRFGEFPFQVRRPNLVQLDVPQETLIPMLGWLKNHTPFVQLTHLTPVDWLEDEQFQLIYTISAPTLGVSLMVGIRINRKKPVAESVFPLWLQAETYEQEANEMFGIEFPGSPRQGVPFILEGWKDIPPMRRDFDTLAYCDKHHPVRPGREHQDSRVYVGRMVGEKGYLS